MKPATLLLALFAVASPLLASAKHAPLPQKLMSAKSVYIDNRSGSAKEADDAYQELEKWGRFQIVDDAQKADITIILSASASDRGTYTNGRADTYGNISATTTRMVIRYGFLTVKDAHSDVILWQDNKRWNIYHGYNVKGLLKELHDRIAEQEKQPTD